VVADEEARRVDLLAALGPLFQGYHDVLILAQSLAEQAAIGGQLRPADLALHHSIFQTADAQLACLRELLQQAPGTPTTTPGS
jgi:hypothetical protein